MNYLRQIHKIVPKDWKRTIDGKTHDLYLAVFGIFDTVKVEWKYYYASCCDSGGITYITSDCSKLSTSTGSATVFTITSSAHSVKLPEEGLKWCEEFKMKWETGSNDLLSEVRDKKLNEILK